jgi:hypothetical protein
VALSRGRASSSRHPVRLTLREASTAPVWSKLNITAFSKSSAIVHCRLPLETLSQSRVFVQPTDPARVCVAWG